MPDSPAMTALAREVKPHSSYSWARVRKPHWRTVGARWDMAATSSGVGARVIALLSWETFSRMSTHRWRPVSSSGKACTSRWR